MGEGVSRNDFVGITTCPPTGTGPARGYRLHKRPRRQCARRVARGIDQLLFPGGYFKEFIFFHKASRTLILTDTIINIELDKISEPWRTAAKLSGMYHPYGQQDIRRAALLVTIV